MLGIKKEHKKLKSAVFVKGYFLFQNFSQAAFLHNAVEMYKLKNLLKYFVKENWKLF